MASIDAALQSMIENLREKTGRSLDEWIGIARRSKLQKHGQLVAMLKSDHSLSHGYANMIALQTLKAGQPADSSEGDPIAALYTGPKEALKPWYDTLAAKVSKFGPDIEFAPKKGYVSLRRTKQFGLIQPSSADRLDVGIVLKGVPPAGRLEASGSFNAMVTHRVRVQSKKEIDGELVGWLKKAYEQA